MTNNLIIRIPLLQEWWRWHCYSHPHYLCLNLHQVPFDYSTLYFIYPRTTLMYSWWICWNLTCWNIKTNIHGLKQPLANHPIASNFSFGLSNIFWSQWDFIITSPNNCSFFSISYYFGLVRTHFECKALIYQCWCLCKLWPIKSISI